MQDSENSDYVWCRLTGGPGPVREAAYLKVWEALLIRSRYIWRVYRRTQYIYHAC